VDEWKSREENKATDLKQIREVNEHVRVGVFLPASDVEAHCDNIHALPAFGEFVLDGKSIHS
jgi:hypothetical protein